MKKIILTEDLVLNASIRTAGKLSEVLLIQQDATGGHAVTLAVDNDGMIDVGRQPNCVTEVSYKVDDDRVYWTSRILTPELIINEPSRITTLTTYIVDSNGVKIRWNAPQGNPPSLTVPTSRYRIYYSESEIDTNYSVKDFPEFKQSLIPKAPTEQEEIVISGLLPGHKYYIVIVSESIIFGKLKTSQPSNVITFITPANDEAGTIFPRIIPLIKENFYPNGLIIPVDEDTGQKTWAQNLADISTIIDEDGVPSGTPPTVGMGIKNYGVGDMPQYNRPSWDCIIDLGAQWTIEYLYVWMITNGEIEVRSSNNGVVFDVFATLNSALPHDSWQKIVVNQTFSTNIRYIQLGFLTKEHTIKGFLLYGKRAEKGTIKGIKYKKTVPSRTFDEYLGTNAFLIEQKEMVREVSRFTRFYVESDWLFRQNGNWNEQGDGEGKTPDEVRYVFASSHIWNFDTKLAEFKATGQKVLYTLNNSPLYLREAGYDSATLAKPVDPGLPTMTLSVTTDPMSYKHYARLAYNLSARYGRNTSPNLDYVQYDTGEPFAVGLDLLEYIEFGNEKDAYWTGANGYHSAHEMAAITSAIYDGHKGLMGEGFGIKQADPTMKLTMSSLALGDNIGYVKAMMLWWDLNRGFGDYPIDAINIHHYNASGGSQTGGDAPSSGIPPEEGEYIHIMEAWDDFRNRQLQNCEIILSEIGYDEQWGGVYSPGYRDQDIRSKYKAYWLPRTFLIGKAIGLDVLNQYWFGNTQVRLLVDVNPNYFDRQAFLTSGYADGTDSAAFPHTVKLVSYWYAGAMQKALEGYSFSHIIIKRGVKQVDALTIDSVNPKLWALAFTNESGGKAICLWLEGTGFNTLTANVYVDASESLIPVLTVDNAEIRQSVVPLLTNKTTLSDVNGKYILHTINECPSVIKTINIGVKKLINPSDVQIEAISNNTLKLSWRDRNIGPNNTKIYQSNLPDQDFIEVVNTYIDNGEYVLTDLSEGENYFFKIQFQSGSLYSEASPSIGITTLSTILPPTNFESIDRSSSSITLGWDYTPEAELNIDLFEIYRSLTSNGIYVLLTSVNKNLRSFIDNGLTADTIYYYKIRAKKDFGYSEYTFSPGETTSPVVLDPPVLLTAKSNYAGDRLKLGFDLAMANPAGYHAAFSVIETLGGTPTNINGARVELDSVDPKILYLYLDNLINNSASTVTVSYNATSANVQSTAGVKLATLSSFPVSNNKNNVSLLSKKIQINLTDSVNLAGADWNNIVMNYNGSTTPFDAQVYTKNLLDVNGVATNIEFIMPMNNAENINTNGYVENDMLQVADPHFPEATNEVAVGIANQTYNGAASLAIFQNLDPTKEYNIRMLLVVFKYNTVTRLAHYKNWQSISYVNKNVPGNSSYITSLKPTNTPYNPHASGGGYPVVDHINDPKVGLNFRYGGNPVWVAGFILEEVIPE